MRKILFIAFVMSLLMNYSVISGQSMNNEKLGEIIYVVADSLRGKAGNWQFVIKDRLLICVTDENNNRMRIMSPIVEQKKLAYTDMLKVMEANFHTALDVKYAISDNLLWSVFIHPLKELNKIQVVDAIQQVYMAASTYGTTYNSSGLLFPDRNKEKRENKKKKI